MFYSFEEKSQFQEKIRYFPLRGVRLLYNPGKGLCYNTLLSNLFSIICQVVKWSESLKTKEKL